ncbi:hypothetical protein BJY01DRAFT_162823 [Aspergillus pseudoustus]|uniref:Uncharacterized protein n=1 Tax=Aspergillus pseudoustus TaxID=1810923 RepID=A0ABR4K706_9EURO
MPTSLITVPILAILSIPLTAIASCTIFISTITLFLQLWFITFRLCSALLISLFTIPHSTSWSLLSFAVSEPTTPARRRSSDYSAFNESLIQYRGQSQSRPTLIRLGSSNPLESPESQDGPIHSFDSRYAHRPYLRKSIPYTHSSSFLGLTNGEEDRDFEGLGGWRCPPSSTKFPGYRSGRTTPSSANSVSDEADNIAWLSINSRLELPSQPLALRHSNNSNNAEASTSPVAPDSHLPWRRNSRVTISEAKDPKRAKSGHRHHQRSATTSMLAGYTAARSQYLRSPSLQPPHPHGPFRDQGIGVRSQSHTSLAEHWALHAGPLRASLNSRSTGNGYFALQPKELGSSSGAKTTSNTTPNEERKPARLVTASLGAMSQYLPSLGNR